jgi:hypothetical protein
MSGGSLFLAHLPGAQQDGHEMQLHLHTPVARGLERADAPDDLGDPSDPLNAHARTLSAKKKQVSPHKKDPL